MSLILEALKKAEQDRHAGQIPVLDEVLVQRPRTVVHRRAQQQDVLLVAGIIAAALFAIAGLAYWFWPAPSAVVAAAPTAASPAASAASVTSEPATAPAATTRVDPERLETPIADAPESPVEAGDTGAAQAMTMDELDGEQSQPAPGKPAKDQAARVARAPAAVVAPAATPEPSAAPVTAAPEPTPAAAPPTPATEAGVRPLKEMPTTFRSEFPKLVVDVHVYDSNPLRRFVLINGKKYRESDTLIEGPRVVEILPNGLVVEQRGSKVMIELPR